MALVTSLEWVYKIQKAVKFFPSVVSARLIQNINAVDLLFILDSPSSHPDTPKVLLQGVLCKHVVFLMFCDSLLANSSHLAVDEIQRFFNKFIYGCFIAHISSLMGWELSGVMKTRKGLFA